MEQNLIERGKAEAERVLLGNGGVLGLHGANRAYQQVWARDSMICSLGLMLCRDAEGQKILRRSFHTLRSYQSPLGNIPHNVGLAELDDPALIAHGGRLEAPEGAAGAGGGAAHVVDTAHSGCIDNSL